MTTLREAAEMALRSMEEAVEYAKFVRAENYINPDAIKSLREALDKSNSQPTPGPWKVVTTHGDCSVEGPYGEEIIWQDGFSSTPTIGRANAHLIAAAPELLAALEALVEDQRDASLPVLVQARAAIKKAHGIGEKE